MYGLQHGALAHTEQQAIKNPTITSVKPFITFDLKSRSTDNRTAILRTKSL